MRQYSGFGTAEEVVPLLKFTANRARVKFENAQMGFLSYMARGAKEGERLTIPLRIVSWNTHAGTKGAEQAVEELASLDPDIALMQEFAHGGNVGMIEATKRSRHFQGYHVKYLGNGTAILSRFPFSQLPNGPLDEWRGSVWRVQIAPGAEITCVNVHLLPVVIRTELIRGLSWRVLADAVSRTRHELESLRDTLDLYAKEGTVIMAGDFNLPPKYADLDIATANLKDCFSASGYGWGKTAPNPWPVIRVDMIFVPRDAEVFYAAAIPTRHSDHRMTVAEVSVPVTLKPKDRPEP